MTTLRRFSWVIGVLGLVLLVAFGSTWFVTREIGTGAFVLGVCSGLMLMLYAFVDGERLSAAADSRAFAHSSGSVVLTLLAVGASAAVYRVSLDRDHRWDLTSDQRFSLSEHAASVAAGLDRDVEVYAFFRAESPAETRFEDLVAGFVQHTDRMAVEIVDPLRSPILAEQFAITTENGTVVLRSGEDSQRLESDFSEEAMTAALVRLQSSVSHRVCWTRGHEEADPDDDYALDGMGAIVVKLEDNNYTVDNLRIATEGFPASCDLVVAVRPKTDWLPAEREAFAAYLAGGGRALVMLEVGLVPELASELERYGVLIGDDVVLEGDPARMFTQQDPSFIALYDDAMSLHPITNNLDGMVALSVARTVSPDEQAAPGLLVRSLLKASSTAWGETDLEATGGPLQPDPGLERVGDVSVAVAVEIDDPGALEVIRRADGPAVDAEGGAAASMDDATRLLPQTYEERPGGRLIVIGDADFAGNQLVSLGNNQDLFLNSVAWLADEEHQLGERPDAMEGQGLTVTLAQELLLWLVAVLLVPGGAVVAALVVMLRRRML